MLDIVREYTTGAVRCPHLAALERSAVYVKDPEGDGPPMALCQLCLHTFREWTVTMPTRLEVTTTMLALGYTEEDATRVWSDLEASE